MTDSPLGPLTLIASGGALAGLYMNGRTPASADAAGAADGADAAVLDEAVRQLAEYFGGQRHAFDLPLALEGTAFQRRVYEELKQIPAGETRTYSEIAKKVGGESGRRAVARACGTNSVAVFIPCHRVVRSDGGMGGYRWGVDRKQDLLARERQKSAN